MPADSPYALVVLGFAENDLIRNAQSAPAKKLSVVLVMERSRDSDALVDRLYRDDGIELVVRTTDAIAVAAGIGPSVILLDIDTPDQDCFETARAILSNHPHCRVMFIGAEVDDRSLQQALDVGALAFLTKREPLGAYVTAIREIAGGRAVFSESVYKRLVAHQGNGSHSEHTVPRKNLLTAREIEIVQYVTQGLADKEIASVAGISPKTVEAHCAHIRNKLGVRGRVDIARFAIREGLASA